MKRALKGKMEATRAEMVAQVLRWWFWMARKAEARTMRREGATWRLRAEADMRVNWAVMRSWCCGLLLVGFGDEGSWVGCCAVLSVAGFGRCSSGLALLGSSLASVLENCCCLEDPFCC